MKSGTFFSLAVASASVLLGFAPDVRGEEADVYWHIDPNVKTCSMVIDPSLTQAQWHTFTRQVAAIMSFKSLAPANPLGRRNFEIAVDYAYTPVDQRDPAWINTFTHPDETCPLGDAISYPTLRARIGISDKVDVGGYWTTAPNANYGMAGGEVRYAFLKESGNRPAATARLAVSMLTGVQDYNVGLTSAEAMVSKTIGRVVPYLGLRQGLVVGTETTSKVDLDTEVLGLTQGYAGVASSVWKIKLAAEYDVASLNTFTFAVGFAR
jgi:hypothetical protein